MPVCDLALATISGLPNSVTRDLYNPTVSYRGGGRPSPDKRPWHRSAGWHDFYLSLIALRESPFAAGRTRHPT